MVKDEKDWFGKKKKEYPTNEDWTFPDIESAFRAMERAMKDEIKEISKKNQHVPTYNNSLENKKITNKKNFIQGYKITTTPNGKTKITKFGNLPPTRIQTNIQSSKNQNIKDLEPLLDVFQTDKEIMVVIELQVANKKDIDIKVNNKQLIVSAKKIDNKFYKKIELPTKIDKKNTKATYKNGVLTITLLKEKN